ncbi:hypothetical protein [Limosilactobacillus reuteri]|uniref:Uncharacterized protein n=1 Tax=Limosilactobacillus reuteri TaxID=1598 RepID=A0A073JQW4_LIMRT|nr:hypothetical protein [Limosilactobacillus reuteri]KEK16094.1 hypothetical protein LR3_08480 [Limosilactobacillus reuteri]MCR1878013.1 hypothetical protein [Limosilactobacillus reuteri]
MIASIGFVILITVFFLIILGISLIIDKVGSYLQNKNLIFKIIVILLVGAGILLVALLTAILIMTITYINKEQIIILHAQKVSSVILGALLFAISSIFFGVPNWSEDKQNMELTFIGKQQKFMVELYIAVLTASIGIWQYIPLSDDFIKSSVEIDNIAALSEPALKLLEIIAIVAFIMVFLMGIATIWASLRGKKVFKYKDDNYETYEPAKYRKSVL